MSPEALSPVSLRTRDGHCRTFVFKPERRGPWPAVIVYMDAFAIRPALLEVAQRIAGYGYLALVPDLFYRSGPYDTMDPKAIFDDPQAFQTLREKHMTKLTVANVMADTRDLLDYLDSEPDAANGPVGTVGYCMGGRFSLAAAGTWPERIGASASFHGGNLATDADDSPHRLAADMRARILVAGASDDRGFPEAMKQRLDTTLTEAGVEHTIETWPARHGWVFRDTPAYDQASSERHFARLERLFAETLGR